MGGVLGMTLVGAALVFAALGVVWLAIMVLVRTTRPEERPFAAPPGAGGMAGAAVAPAAAPVPPALDEPTLRTRAAAIAVAVAVARWQTDVAAAGSSEVSPWQAATRAQRLQQKTPRGR